MGNPSKAEKVGGEREWGVCSKTVSRLGKGERALEQWPPNRAEKAGLCKPYREKKEERMFCTLLGGHLMGKGGRGLPFRIRPGCRGKGASGKKRPPGGRDSAACRRGFPSSQDSAISSKVRRRKTAQNLGHRARLNNVNKDLARREGGAFSKAGEEGGKGPPPDDMGHEISLRGEKNIVPR